MDKRKHGRQKPEKDALPYQQAPRPISTITLPSAVNSSTVARLA